MGIVNFLLGFVDGGVNVHSDGDITVHLGDRVFSTLTLPGRVTIFMRSGLKNIEFGVSDSRALNPGDGLGASVHARMIVSGQIGVYRIAAWRLDPEVWNVSSGRADAATVN